MLSMNTPSLLTWGSRIYFYCLLILSFNIPSLFGIFLSVTGFMLMEHFCEELTENYQLNRTLGS
jgi:hypothetical protein